MSLPLTLRCTSSRHCPSTPASLSAHTKKGRSSNSCKDLCIFSFYFTLRQLECGDEVPDCHCLELSQNELSLCLFVRSIASVVPEAPCQTDNGRQTHLVHYLFVSLRGPAHHDRTASHPSPAPVIDRDVFQSCDKGDVRGEQRWLCRRTLTRGVCPLLLRRRLLTFLCCVSPLNLFPNAFVLKRGRTSEIREALP